MWVIPRSLPPRSMTSPSLSHLVTWKEGMLQVSGSNVEGRGFHTIPSSKESFTNSWPMPFAFSLANGWSNTATSSNSLF
jgi:hypothetical protein